MQKKPPILLLAIVLGLVALGGTAYLLSKGPGKVAPIASAPGVQVAAAAQPTPVPEMRYIANRDIPPRTTITSDMMRRTAISGPMPTGAITSLDEVRRLITKRTIRSGDTVTRDSFIDPLDRVIPANFTIPNGFRAVAIYVDPKQTAAGVVDVGDRVDVISVNKWSWDTAEDQRVVGAKEFSTGRTVGTDLLVLAVDESLAATPVTPTPTPAAGGVAGAPGAPAPAANLPADAAPPPANSAPPETRPGNNVGPDAKSGSADAKPEGNIRVILAAPLETASRLVAANSSGVLHVLVRNPLDGDAERGPETQEYPSRVVTVNKPDSGGSGTALELAGVSGNKSGGGSNKSSGGRSNGPAFPVPDLPDVTISQDSAPPPMPMPVPPSAPSSNAPSPSEIGGSSGGDATATAPSGPAMRDVMVVRGTEKNARHRAETIVARNAKTPRLIKRGVFRC